jgi:hypothetical protein
MDWPGFLGLEAFGWICYIAGLMLARCEQNVVYNNALSVETAVGGIWA